MGREVPALVRGLRPERVAPSGQLKAGVPFCIVRFMPTDELRSYHSDLLDGSYDCVDRIVLNANFGLCYSAGGFRTWWRRLHNGSDEELDNTHLMRMAGRFSRCVRLGESERGSRPRLQQRRTQAKIAEEHLKKNPGVRGLFLILVGRAMATVWDVKRSSSGVLVNLEAKRAFINHYSFHILDPGRWSRSFRG